MDDAAFGGDLVRVWVVEPHPIGAEVAEVDCVAGIDGDAGAAGAVLVWQQGVAVRVPVVEGADDRHRSVVRVGGQRERDRGLSFGLISGDTDRDLCLLLVSW